MHKVANQIEQVVNIPLLHIVDATAQRLTQKYGIEVLIPDSDSRAQIHRIIYTELCKGAINPPQGSFI
ncbi:MAG: aspartate racemase [Oceanospirillaceae bacterium]|jgi:aspartate racemase